MIYWCFFEPDKKKERITALEEEMAKPDFWSDKKNSETIIEEVNYLKNTLNKIKELKDKIETSMDMLEELKTTRDNDIRTILGNKIFSNPRVSTNTLISMKLGMIFGNTELWEDISSIPELTDEKIAKLYGTSVDNVQMMHTFSAKAKELEEAKKLNK